MDDFQPSMTLNRREQNLGAVISIFAITLLLMYVSFSFSGFDSELVMLGIIGGALLLSSIFSIVVLRKYRRAKTPWMIDYLNVGVQRYILGLFMIMYGIDKLLGNFFDYQLYALDTKLGEVSEFQLAWFFYGKNRWQELFAGFMEFVPGIFLLFRKTYFIAAIALLPVTAQVFLLNLFFKIGGVTFPAATILLACNGYIIYSQKPRILLFFRSLNFARIDPGSRTVRRTIAVFRGIAIFLAVAIIFLRIRPLVIKSPYQRLYAGLVGVYTLKEMKKNGLPYAPVNDSAYYKDLYIEKQSRWNILRKFDGSTDAFVLRLSTKNDSLGLYLNRGGIGDQADIIDSATALQGTYKLSGNDLRIRGLQQNDTLDLVYERQARIRPKEWLW